MMKKILIEPGYFLTFNFPRLDTVIHNVVNKIYVAIFAVTPMT